MSSTAQTSILAPPPPAGRFLTLGLQTGASAHAAIERVARLPVGDGIVVGIGDPLVRALGRTGAIAGLRIFPALDGPGGVFPSTQGALWIFLGGADRGELLHRARHLLVDLGDTFRVDEDVASFVHAGGRDLSGFEDGTENPKDARAIEVAIAAGGNPSLTGSSFVATQRWVHDLAHLDALPAAERNDVIGRDRDTNAELPDAPASAHVKRTAQETFTPPAFILRRSMPWGDARQQGLYFVAYGASLDPFERVLRHMAGLDDGIADALLRFSRPTTGGYFWCPPVRQQGDAVRLDLRALGL